MWPEVAPLAPKHHPNSSPWLGAVHTACGPFSFCAGCLPQTPTWQAGWPGHELIQSERPWAIVECCGERSPAWPELFLFDRELCHVAIAIPFLVRKGWIDGTSRSSPPENLQDHMHWMIGPRTWVTPVCSRAVPLFVSPAWFHDGPGDCGTGTRISLAACLRRALQNNLWKSLEPTLTFRWKGLNRPWYATLHYKESPYLSAHIIYN